MQGNITKKRLISFAFEKTACIGLNYMLFSVQYQEYEYGLLKHQNLKVLSKETKVCLILLKCTINIGTSLGHFVVSLSMYGLRTSCLPPPRRRSSIGDFEGGGW